jgi:hypothetical protein
MGRADENALDVEGAGGEGLNTARKTGADRRRASIYW